MTGFARSYPAWGVVKDVPFNETFLETVGFLIGDRGDGDRGPVGTFFVIQEERDGWDGQEDRGTVRWMVTARHVVEDSGPIEARMRTAWRHGQHVKQWDANDWEFDTDDTVDIAIRPLDFDGPANTFKALPIAYALPSWPLFEFFGGELGWEVFFAGLLDWPGEIAAEARPIVRSGTVAARNQTGLWWHTDAGTRIWSASPVHLVDIRSRGGFSGSPSWVHVELSHPDPENLTLPNELAQMYMAMGADPKDFDSLATVSWWWGMFVAHDDASGVGIVIPAAQIVSMLDLPKVREMKKKEEEKQTKARLDRAPKGQSVAKGNDEMVSFTQLAQKLVNVPKDELDAEREKDQ